jgi:hypothetical protein
MKPSVTGAGPALLLRRRIARGAAIAAPVLVSLLAIACGGGGPATTSGGGGTGGTGGAGGACASDAHRSTDGICDTTLAWSAGPAIGVPRDHHMTFVVDTGSARFLYVAGGYSQAQQMLLTSVVRAPIDGQGALGAWEDAADLPVGMSGAGVVVTHDEVILTGGFGSTDTWIAPVKTDGSLGTWASGPKLSGVRFHAAAVTRGDFVFVVGGIAGSQTSDEVQRATIGQDGSLSPWETVAHLPYSLSHHVAVVDGATLYVIGGQTGNTNNNSGTPHKETFAATLGDDGSVGAWQMTGDLPFAYETSAGLVHDGLVWIVGGILDKTSSEASGLPTADVLRAKILGPGKLDTWALDAASALPAARSHVHQVPILGGHVYSVSGMIGAAGDTPDVYVGVFQ